MSEELFNSASCSGDCADCGSDCQDLDQPTVTLTLDDDTEMECGILGVFEVEGLEGKEYIALLPLDENLEPNEAGDVYLYQYNETEDGEPDLGNIEDDDEYEIAADAFDEWMDSQEFDESDVEE